MKIGTSRIEIDRIGLNLKEYENNLVYQNII